jgi:hypothetical protein
VSRGIVYTAFRLKPLNSVVIPVADEPFVVNESLARFALYWDEIDMPVVTDTDATAEQATAAFSTTTPQALQRTIAPELAALGILKHTSFAVDARMPADLLGAAAEVPFFALAKHEANEAERGKWALAHDESELAVPINYQNRRSDRTVLVGLHNALPMPDAHVPVEKLLKFRDDRGAELGELRQALDEMYQQIITSPDPQHAMQVATARVEKALAEWRKASDVSWLKRKVESVKAYLAAPTLGEVVGGASVATSTVVAGASAAWVAAAAVAPFIWNRAKNISLSVTLPVGVASSAAKPFAYAFLAGRLS